MKCSVGESHQHRGKISVALNRSVKMTHVGDFCATKKKSLELAGKVEFMVIRCHVIMLSIVRGGGGLLVFNNKGGGCK